MERKLTAILSADVEGYSRLMGEDEEATIRTLTSYRQVMGALIPLHRGRVMDSPGDNLTSGVWQCGKCGAVCRGDSDYAQGGKRQLTPAPQDGVSYRY